MSRRRNQPNLPEETLRRARRAAGLLPEEEAAAETPPEAPEAVVAGAITEDEEDDSRAAKRAARRRRRLDRATETARAEEKMDAAEIAERLRAPTRTVSEGELRAAYSYVLRDLRSMGILAAALIGALVLLAVGLGV